MLRSVGAPGRRGVADGAGKLVKLTAGGGGYKLERLPQFGSGGCFRVWLVCVCFLRTQQCAKFLMPFDPGCRGWLVLSFGWGWLVVVSGVFVLFWLSRLVLAPGWVWACVVMGLLLACFGGLGVCSSYGLSAGLFGSGLASVF